MPALVTTIDVTAKSGSAATLDRGHGAAPRTRQRRAMLLTERRAEVAEYVRHFQPLAGHRIRASGGYEVRRVRHEDVERLQRTGGGADLAGGDHEISRRGAQVAMTKQ